MYHFFFIIEMENDFFMVQIHYGGSIKYHPNYHYSEGYFRFFNYCDLDRFNITELQDMLN